MRGNTATCERIPSSVVALNPFGKAIKTRLRDLNRTQEWLGAEVAALLGRPEPYGQTGVSGWIVRGTASPELVFTIERALNCKPGELSRHLGYVPSHVAGVKPPVVTVEEAVMADASLPSYAKRALLAAYRELRDGA